MTVFTRLKSVTALVAALALSSSIVGVPHAAAEPIGAPSPDMAAGSGGYDVNPDMYADPIFETVELAHGGESGYNCYRIPSLGVAKDGTILASYDGRPHDCQDAPQGNSIVLRRSTDNGATWSDQVDIAPGQNHGQKFGYSDPSIITDWQTGTLFNFHVKSFNTGIGGSQEGTDPTDRSVIHAAYAKSTDNGLNWTYDHVITADVTNHSDWRARFATSGNGIQKQYEPHAGRLIQPAMVIRPDQWGNVAWYSDDHGETWQSGELFGNHGDENKMVEISDGRIMDNGRSSKRGQGVRIVAYSDDGGHSFTDPVGDPNLPDPHNNASIIRLFPNAPQGSAKSKVLLFSNTANGAVGFGNRNNATIRMSCDDGQTWPVSKLFKADDIQYTSMATLPDGTVGVLWENHNHENHNNIHFTKFNLAWMGGSCMSVDATDATIPANQTSQVNVTISNPVGGAIVDQPLRFNAPSGWNVTADNITLAPGEEKTVPVTIQTPADAWDGPNKILVSVANGLQIAQDPFTITVTGGRDVSQEVTVTSEVLGTANKTLVEGETIRYRFVVNNPTPHQVSVVPHNRDLSNFDPNNRDKKNCRWLSFPARSKQNCDFASYTVTAEDVERGYVQFDTRWDITPKGGPTQETESLTVYTPKNDVSPTVVHDAAVTVALVEPVQSNGGEQNVPLQASVTVTDDAAIPDGTTVRFYADGVEIGSSDVTEGRATIDFPVANVAPGEEEKVYAIVGRLILPSEQVRNFRTRDGLNTVTVLPQAKPEIQRTVTVEERNAVVSNGSPQTVLLAATVTDPGGVAQPNTEVTFLVDDEPLGTAMTDDRGRAVIEYEVDSIAAGEPDATKNIKATVARVEKTAEILLEASNTVSLVVKPEPTPVTETSTSTTTTTVATPTTVTETSTTTAAPVTTTITKEPTTITLTEQQPTTTVTKVLEPEVLTTTTTVEQPVTTTITSVPPAVTTTTTEPTTVTETSTTTSESTVSVTETTTATETSATTVTETSTATETTKEPVPTTVTSTEKVTETSTATETTKEPVPTTVTSTEKVTETATTTETEPVPTTVPTTVTETTVVTETPTTTVTTVVEPTVTVTKSTPTTVTETVTLPAPDPITTTETVQETVTETADASTVTVEPSPTTITTTQLAPTTEVVTETVEQKVTEAVTTTVTPEPAPAVTETVVTTTTVVGNVDPITVTMTTTVQPEPTTAPTTTNGRDVSIGGGNDDVTAGDRDDRDINRQSGGFLGIEGEAGETVKKVAIITPIAAVAAISALGAVLYYVPGFIRFIPWRIPLHPNFYHGLPEWIQALSYPVEEWR